LAGSVCQALPAAAAEPSGAPVEPKRVRVLDEYLGVHAATAFLEPYEGAVVGTLSLGGAVALAVGDLGESPRGRWPAVASLGVAGAGAFATYLLPVDYRPRLNLTAALVGLPTAFMFMVALSDNASPATRVTVFGAMGGMLGMAGLGVLDIGLQRPVSATTFGRDQVELRRAGQAVTPAMAARFEEHMRLAGRRPIPGWLYGLSLAAGGVVAFSPVFSSETSHPDKKLAMGFGIGMFVAGAYTSTLALISTDGYTQYSTALRRLELVPIGPAGSPGVSLAGAF